MFLQFQSAHPRRVRCRRSFSGCCCTSFNPRTHEGCDSTSILMCWACLSFNPRTHEGCDSCHLSPAIKQRGFNPRTHEGCDNLHRSVDCAIIVSIRAPTRGAMATHSKIRPFRALVSPLSQQNRHVLENPFPLTHPCVRHLREKTCRFYVCLRFALRRLLWLISPLVCCGCKISVVHAKRPLFGQITSPNQARHSTLLDNQRPHQTFLLAHHQDIVYKECSTFSKVFCQKTKEKINRRFKDFFH